MSAYKKGISICLLLVFAISWNAVSQTGIYRKTDKTGASCTLSLIQKGNHIHSDIFAWWHTASETHGAFSGDGRIQNNKVIFKGNEDGSNCIITFTLQQKSLTATFDDCMTYNLPEDFSGNYIKITEKIPGNYIIVTDKSYFFKEPTETAKLQKYLVKGDQVAIDLENIIDANWVFVNFTNASGKTTSAYMQWRTMK